MIAAGPEARSSDTWLMLLPPHHITRLPTYPKFLPGTQQLDKWLWSRLSPAFPLPHPSHHSEFQRVFSGKCSWLTSPVFISVSRCQSAVVSRAFHASAMQLKTTDEQKQQPPPSFSQQHSETHEAEEPNPESSRSPPRYAPEPPFIHFWPFCVLGYVCPISPSALLFIPLFTFYHFSGLLWKESMVFLGKIVPVHSKIPKQYKEVQKNKAKTNPEIT